MCEGGLAGTGLPPPRQLPNPLYPHQRNPRAPTHCAPPPRLLQDNGANTMDVAEYHASTEPSQGPAAFLTGHQLRQHCYTRQSSGGWARCPRPFPCNSRLDSVLGMGRCYLPLPAGPRTGYLHFVRNPISVVVSAYLYHTQQPPPEDWIWRFNVSSAGGAGGGGRKGGCVAAGGGMLAGVAVAQRPVAVAQGHQPPPPHPPPPPCLMGRPSATQGCWRARACRGRS